MSLTSEARLNSIIEKLVERVEPSGHATCRGAGQNMVGARTATHRCQAVERVHG